MSETDSDTNKRWDLLDIEAWNPWWGRNFSRLQDIKQMQSRSRRSDYRYHLWSALTNRLTVINGPAQSGKTTTLMQLAADIGGSEPKFESWHRMKEGDDQWDTVAADDFAFTWWDGWGEDVPRELVCYIPVSDPLMHSSTDGILVNLVGQYEDEILSDSQRDERRILLLDDIDLLPDSSSNGETRTWDEQVDELLQADEKRHVVLSTSSFDRLAEPLATYRDEAVGGRNVSDVVSSKFFDYTFEEHIPSHVADQLDLKERIYELRNELAHCVEDGDLEPFYESLQTLVNQPAFPVEAIRQSLADYLYTGGIRDYSRVQTREAIEQTIFRNIVQANEDVAAPGQMYALCAAAARYPPERVSFSDLQERVGFPNNRQPKNYVETLDDYAILNPIYKLNHQRTRSVYPYLQNPGYVNALATEAAANEARRWHPESDGFESTHLKTVAQTALANHLQRLLVFGFDVASHYTHRRVVRCWTDVNCEVEFVIQPGDRLLPIVPAFTRSVSEADNEIARFTFRVSADEQSSELNDNLEYDKSYEDPPDPEIGIVVVAGGDIRMYSDDTIILPLWTLQLLA